MAAIKNWKEKYKTLEEYYKNEFDPKYYSFNKYELEIDPLETIEEIEQYDANRQKEEIIKCVYSFEYFCHKYVKITHPIHGLIPFILYNYQRRVTKEYESHRFNILSKFRQGGLTTVTVIWLFWRCLFKLNETIMVMSKSDREAIAAGEIVKSAIEELPAWLRPQMSKNNDHQKIFDETGCRMFFYTPEAARSRSITWLFIDEAAFIPNMDKHWKAMFPTLSTGGNCICISTVNGVGNWYYNVFMGAKNKKGFGSEFNVIELDYWEHPEYNNDEWVRKTKAQLGEKGWLQEVCRNFLGSGESYIPPHIINEIENNIKDIQPIKKLFSKWKNNVESEEFGGCEEAEDGAFHVWREPVEGRDYILGVDSAEGMGGDNDNSCIQVIDAVTCEQCAEFYSNTIPMHEFANMAAMIGKRYNNALIVVEALGPGLVILDKLQNELYYDNLFVEQKNEKTKNIKPGIKTNRTSRPKLMEALQTRIINRNIAIRSKRLLKELKGFVWNQSKKRPEASPGFHDDAILALCLALYARDNLKQYEYHENQEQYTEAYKAAILDEIKKELEKDEYDLNDSELNEMLSNALSSLYDEDELEWKPNITRPYDAILREFGW